MQYTISILVENQPGVLYKVSGLFARRGFIKVRVLQPGSFYSCYLSLIKVSSNAQQRADIMKIAELMNAQIVDVATDCLTLQFTDSVERTETLISLLKPYGIKEIVRAGALAIEKGSAVARRKGN